MLTSDRGAKLCPEKGNKVGEGSGAQVLCLVVEEIGIFLAWRKGGSGEGLILSAAT